MSSDLSIIGEISSLEFKQIPIAFEVNLLPIVPEALNLEINSTKDLKISDSFNSVSSCFIFTSYVDIYSFIDLVESKQSKKIDACSPSSSNLYCTDSNSLKNPITLNIVIPFLTEIIF